MFDVLASVLDDSADRDHDADADADADHAALPALPSLPDPDLPALSHAVSHAVSHAAPASAASTAAAANPSTASTTTTTATTAPANTASYSSHQPTYASSSAAVHPAAYEPRSPPRYSSNRAARTPYDRPSASLDDSRPKPPLRSSGAGSAGSAGTGTAGLSGAEAARKRNCRVYIGNLSFDTTWRDLKDYMRKAGEVLFADVMIRDGRSKGCGIAEFATAEEASRAIRELHETTFMGRQIFVREDREPDSRMSGGMQGRPTDRDAFRDRDRDDRDRPMGRDSFRDRGGPMDRDSYRDHDRDFDRGRDRDSYGDSECRVFVGNLPFIVGWQDLKDLFRRAAPVTRADVFLGPDKRSRGMGLATFGSMADAQAAICA
ncbi:hypothetical protein BC831DRAFT_241501 [Entophlyctis helioformis]|nr:hypothetical protein BC831DRAFT_241501 [Entophlyctis helioformis]